MWIVLTRVLRAAISLVPTDHFFHLSGIFQRYLLARFTDDKVLRRSRFHLKGILKVLLNGTVMAYLTCHEGFKDENYSETVVHDVR